MKLYFRLLWLLLTKRWRPPCNILDPINTRLRVYPSDLDIMRHVNSGVFLNYADIGRTDLMLRSGTLGKILRKRWYPLTAGVTVEFRKSLKLGQRLTVRTHVMGWDETSVYIGQEIIRDDTTVARIMVDARFVSGTGNRVRNDAVVKLLGIDQPSPEFSPSLVQWINSRKIPEIQCDSKKARIAESLES